MIRVYRTPKYFITSDTRKGAEEAAGKEKLTYLGISKPLDGETRDRLGIKHDTRIGVVETKLDRDLAGEQIKMGRNTHLILLNNYPRLASKSTLYHEAEHTLQGPWTGETARKVVRQEVATEVSVYEKTGVPKHNKRTMGGLMNSVAQDFELERKSVKKLILAELKRQKAPRNWITEFRREK